MSSRRKREAGTLSYDRMKVKVRLNGFDTQNSQAFNYLFQHCHRELKHFELFQLAEYLSMNYPELRVDREAKRRKSILLKWYEEHFTILKPLLDNIVFEDEDHKFYGKRKDDPRLVPK